MKFNETLLWIIFIVVVSATPFITDAADSRKYMSEFLKEEDRVITSPNYPKPYPPNQNFTWLCSSTDVKWAVVFLDFQLEASSGNFREYDWLDLDDGRRTLRYSSFSQPHLPYKSSGHYLRMTFITDSVSGGKARGFELQLLHGKDDHEIAVKIHALKTRKTEQGDDDGNRQLLLIIVAVIAAILLIVFIVATMLCFLYHRRVNRLTLTDRDAFGVRRNSGVYHSRNSGSREHHTSEVVIVARQTHRVPPESQQRSQVAPVQRSNSQRDWRSRAELCAMVTVSSQNARPNMYSHSGHQPQACSGREPDKVPDFNSFDDCCTKPLKNSKGVDCNNAGSSTTCKSNPYHLDTNLAAPPANQSACGSLSKTVAAKKCNNNDYTNIHLSKDINSKPTNQEKESQEPGSPVYCNSPISSPTSPGLRDGFTLNLRVGSLDSGPTSPSDRCYENVSVSENQEMLDKNLKATSVYTNSPDDTQVRRKHPFEENCPCTRKDEFQTVVKNQENSKCYSNDGLENILEVRSSRPTSTNPYSNWENICKESKELSMFNLSETKIKADNSSSPSADIKHDDVNECSLMACANIQKPEEKTNEMTISDPNVYQMDTKVPSTNILWSTDVKSNYRLRDINDTVPFNKEHEPQNSSRAITRQFTLELPAVNTGDYLYLTEFGISPIKPEKEWRTKGVSFAQSDQMMARVPKLSTSQSITSDEEEYHLIPNAQDTCKKEESPNAVALQLNAILPKTTTSSLPPESSSSDFGEYHLLPLVNERAMCEEENTDDAVSIKQSMDAMELQLNSKIPRPNNISLSSPGNSGEYHFLPSSHDKPSPPEENGLNRKFSPPNSTFPPPEMKDNSNEGEYHYLFPCNKIPENDQKYRGADIPEQRICELGTEVPPVSSPLAIENPDGYYIIPKTISVDVGGQKGDVKFSDSDKYQLTSKVPISNKLPDDKVSNCGEYHYLVTSRNDEQDTTQKMKVEETEISIMNRYQLNLEVPKPSYDLSSNDDGKYHLLPIKN